MAGCMKYIFLQKHKARVWDIRIIIFPYRKWKCQSIFSKPCFYDSSIWEQRSLYKYRWISMVDLPGIRNGHLRFGIQRYQGTIGIAWLWGSKS